MSKTFLLMILVLVLSLGNLPVLVISDTFGSTLDSSTPTLNSISQLDPDESLTILVLFNDSSQEESSAIQAAMLFFHTSDGQFFLFWMLGDPFSQAQNWQTGMENEHFQIEGELLTLTFIEFQSISDPEINIIILAKITSDFKVTAVENDFRTILNQFTSHLSPSYEVITTEGCIEVLLITQIGASISIILDYIWYPITLLPTTSEGTSGTLITSTSETETSTSQGTTGIPLFTSTFIILSGICLLMFITKKSRQNKIKKR